MKEMKVEVLSEPADYKASTRMKKIMATPEQVAEYRACPGSSAVRGGEYAPGIPDDDYGEVS